MKLIKEKQKAHTIFVKAHIDEVKEFGINTIVRIPYKDSYGNDKDNGEGIIRNITQHPIEKDTFVLGINVNKFIKIGTFKNEEDIELIYDESLQFESTKLANDLRGGIEDTQKTSIFNEPTQFTDILNEPGRPVFTGYIGVDLRLPISRGQKMVITGEKDTGKSSLMKYIAFNQKDIGEDVENVRNVDIQNLTRTVYLHTDGAKAFSTSDQKRIDEYISVKASNYYEVYVGAFRAMAIAQNYSKAGYQVLFLMDSLSDFIYAYGRLSGELDIPLRNSSPLDLFTKVAKLLSPAKHWPDRGAITAIVSMSSPSDIDIEYMIDENSVKSITDGHITLSKTVKDNNIVPAIMYNTSVSRLRPDYKENEWLNPQLVQYINKIINNYYMYKSRGNIENIPLKADKDNALAAVNIVENGLNQPGYNSLLSVSHMNLLLSTMEMNRDMEVRNLIPVFKAMIENISIVDKIYKRSINIQGGLDIDDVQTILVDISSQLLAILQNFDQYMQKLNGTLDETFKLYTVDPNKYPVRIEEIREILLPLMTTRTGSTKDIINDYFQNDPNHILSNKEFAEYAKKIQIILSHGNLYTQMKN